MVEAISLRYMCTVFPAYNNSLSVTILNSQRSSQRPKKCSGFRSKSSFYCDSSVSYGLKIILPHSSSNFNDWPVKLKGDRYALQMIISCSYCPTYDLGSVVKNMGVRARRKTFD